MKQQTAIEWLENKLKTYLSWSSFLEEDFEQAKKLEAEQMKEQRLEGYKEGIDSASTYYSD